MPPLIDPNTAATSAPRLRASDSDRLATVERLQDAVARGLLTLDEGSERMADAFAAVHLTDLAPLTADLPPAPRERVAPGWRSLGTLAVEQLRASLAAAAAATGRVRAARAVVVLVVASLCFVLVGALSGVAMSDGGDGGAGWGEHQHQDDWDDDDEDDEDDD